MAAAEVKSVATRRFWDLFNALPGDVQNLAIKNYQLWRRNPQHPSLRFRRLQGSTDRFTVRVGDHYRALGSRSNQKKHTGIDFETASRIFGDPNLMLRKDRVVDGEQRWHGIGAYEGLCCS